MKTKGRGRDCGNAGYTLIELLAVMLIVALATIAYAEAKNHGTVVRMMAGLSGGVAGFGIVAVFYKWSWRRDRQRLENAGRNCPVYKSIHPEIETPISFTWG